MVLNYVIEELNVLFLIFNPDITFFKNRQFLQRAFKHLILNRLRIIVIIHSFKAKQQAATRLNLDLIFLLNKSDLIRFLLIFRANF